jgi:hypothetical protein
MPIDWNAAGQSLLDGFLWGTGFAVPFFVGITYAILKILSHPTIRNLSRAAAKLGGESGDIWTTLIKEGGRFLRGGKE